MGGRQAAGLQRRLDFAGAQKLLCTSWYIFWVGRWRVSVFFMLARGMGVMNRISRVALPKGFWLVEGPSQDIDDRYSRRRGKEGLYTLDNWQPTLYSINCYIGHGAYSRDSPLVAVFFLLNIYLYDGRVHLGVMLGYRASLELREHIVKASRIQHPASRIQHPRSMNRDLPSPPQLQHRR